MSEHRYQKKTKKWCKLVAYSALYADAFLCLSQNTIVAFFGEKEDLLPIDRLLPTEKKIAGQRLSQRRKWLDDIKGWTRLSYLGLKKAALLTSKDFRIFAKLLFRVFGKYNDFKLFTIFEYSRTVFGKFLYSFKLP